MPSATRASGLPGSNASARAAACRMRGTVPSPRDRLNARLSFAHAAVNVVSRLVAVDNAAIAESTWVA